MRFAALAVLLVGCLVPVGEGGAHGQPGCSEETRTLRIPTTLSPYLRGEFFQTTQGDLAFSAYVGADSSFDTWWANEPDSVEAFDSPGGGPFWFHPDGLRQVRLALRWFDVPRQDNVVWLVEFSRDFRTRKATRIATFAPHDSLLLTAPGHVTRRQIDVCLSPEPSGVPRILSFDDRTMVRRDVPDDVSFCLDAAEVIDETRFLVELRDGGRGVLRVGASASSVGLSPVAMRGDCRLLGKRDGGEPSMWCSEGSSLVRYESASSAAGTAEIEGGSQLQLLADVEDEDAVFLREQFDGSVRYSLVGSLGRRVSVDFASDALEEQWFFGKAGGRWIVGAGFGDGGKEVHLVCW